MDKEQLKQFAKEVMEELHVSGGKISKFIQTIAPQYEYDKKGDFFDEKCKELIKTNC
jgi:hypothetical protein